MRDTAELARVDQLLARLGADAPGTREPASEAITAWQGRVRERAAERWRRLLPDFALVGDATRGDLVLADVVSLGPVGDLSRSLLLLFSAIERKLRERLLIPLRGASSWGDKRRSKLAAVLDRVDHPAGLGAILGALQEPAAGYPTSDPRMVLARTLPAGSLSGLFDLQMELTGVDGTAVGKPLDQRNAIAHGRGVGLPRIGADAIRRLLTLGPRPVLATVIGIKFPQGQ